jgi:hypothetical protein
MAQAILMTEEQREHIVRLARADPEFWAHLKKKEQELEKFHETHDDPDGAEELLGVTYSIWIKRFVIQHLGDIPNIDWSGAIVPLRTAIRRELNI